MVEIPKKGKCLKYKTDRNSWAKNKKELNPKKAIICVHSKLNLGETLSGDSFQVFVEGMKKLKFNIVSNSGTHNAKSTNTKRFTFVQIIVPFASIEKKLTQQPNEIKFTLIDKTELFRLKQIENRKLAFVKKSYRRIFKYNFRTTVPYTSLNIKNKYL
ncbi:hypothetical protein DLM76_20465 [Leptospira yasudae]|nr:hypothetical protein DLM76_20465 [Leptospira yasudae]